jgi:hypothetical protein
LSKTIAEQCIAASYERIRAVEDPARVPLFGLDENSIAEEAVSGAADTIRSRSESMDSSIDLGIAQPEWRRAIAQISALQQ